jgi:Protein of unknown function (DUF4058)
MASPFPGMDPYIEISHLYEDFHSHLIDEMHRFLSDLLPDRYVIRAGERSYVALIDLDEEEEKKRPFLPDVAVVSRRRPARPGRKPKGSARAGARDEPGAVTMRALVKAEYREPFLEIRQVDPEHKLITGIEVLSPSNKRPNTKGWRLYYRKRLAFLSGYANLVEVDLLRRGRRMPMASAWPDSPYYLLVCRKKQAPSCSVWPASFTEPLSPIPIPLAPPDADIALDIQPFVAAIYARSRYERDIDYRRPLDPPPSPAEAAWLEERLRGQQPSA